MKKRTIIIAGISIVLLLTISIIAGYAGTRKKNNQNNISISTDSPTLPTSEESTDKTTFAANASAYKIILEGNRLLMYFKDELINESTISPDVLPVTDVKALRDGISYETEESALLDWESLCN